ncbi:MAG TPA: hypothetical protein VG873_07780 [Burkholderiales bacterium]|nr:hypothetical protein [Burkholderiales bacterium]
MDLSALVHSDVADLVPQFLASRRRDVEDLRNAIAARAFGQLERLACRMYGAGNPYGFRQVTTFGKQLREASAREDLDSAARIVSEYAVYLDTVRITIVDAPPKRKPWVPRLVERRRDAREGAPEEKFVERRKEERRAGR